MRGIGLGLVLVLVGLGCGTTGDRFASLPERDRVRFEQCLMQIEPATCGDGQTATYRELCRGELRESYAANPDRAARRDWLFERGCERRVAMR